MQSVAQQTTAEMGGRSSVLSRQKRDHVKLDTLLQRLRGAAASDQDRILLSIYRLVFPHAYAEETVLWPFMRRILPDGHQLTLRVEREHQEINELVTRLEKSAPGSSEHQQLLGRVIDLLQQDVRDEEDILLPRLQAKAGPRHLRLLGMAWEAVRWISPTRAHAIVGRRPPGNLLAALPLMLLDHCRDGVDALLHRGAGAAAPTLRALSAGLTRASHAVEQLPGMRVGEDRSTRVERKPATRWGAAAIAAAAAVSLLIARSQRRARSA